MTVPVEVKKGAATFTADGVQKVVPFTAKYPKWNNPLLLSPPTTKGGERD